MDDWTHIGQFINNIGLPMSLLLVIAWSIRQFCFWLEPKVTAVLDAHLRFVNTMQEQYPLQIARLDRHSDVLEDIHPKINEIHEVVVSDSDIVKRIAAKRLARAERHAAQGTPND